MSARPDVTGHIRRAAGEMIAKADETQFADLHSLYLEIAEMLVLCADAIDARDVEIGVLRTELAAANERASLNAENARLWFDRVAALGTMPAVASYISRPASNAAEEAA